MSLERKMHGGSLIDVLDRVLDRGIEVDARSRAALGSVDLAGDEARLVVQVPDPGCSARHAAPGAVRVTSPPEPGDAAGAEQALRRQLERLEP